MTISYVLHLIWGQLVLRDFKYSKIIQESLQFCVNWFNIFVWPLQIANMFYFPVTILTPGDQFMQHVIYWFNLVNQLSFIQHWPMLIWGGNMVQQTVGHIWLWYGYWLKGFNLKLFILFKGFLKIIKEKILF